MQPRLKNKRHSCTVRTGLSGKFRRWDLPSAEDRQSEASHGLRDEPNAPQSTAEGKCSRRARRIPASVVRSVTFAPDLHEAACCKTRHV
jgi:hypothetical protein